jgi:hypothetical protein
MINLAETDCGGCQHSATEFETGVPVQLADGGTATWTAASVVEAGGVVIEVLETTGFTTQATQASLQQWIGAYMLPVTTVKDPDGTGTPTLDMVGARDQAYIIDLTTMTIIDFIEGSTGPIALNSGGLAIQKMAMLLGK